MKFIADLHIHSHFSRATSKSLDPEHLSLWAKKKGITVVGTGDFTHPGWVSELHDKMVETRNGLYRLKPELEKSVEREVPGSCKIPTSFILSGEISCIYKKNGKTRKLHHLILMPDMASVIRLNKKLDRIGNIKSDGRPILGLDSRDLLEIVLDADENAFFIPAHVWTPWFSVFGSKSGFDSLEECFEDLTGHIYALETGLSSDPPMNRLLSALDKYILVSNSDAHSPGKLGREANLFDTEPDYDHMIRAMKNGSGFLGTIEFFPEEGKYHLDGHRKCQVRLGPRETRGYNGRCPKCGKPLTVGVLNRVDQLSDRDTPKLSKDFHSLIPLNEILSELLECGPGTKKVMNAYEDLLAALGPELHILMDTPIKDIERAGGLLLSKAIDRMRRNKVILQPGYDGEYGVIHLFEQGEKHELTGQKALFKPVKKKGQKKSHHSAGWIESNETRDEAEIKPAGRIESRRDPDETDAKPEQGDADNEYESPDPILSPLNPAQRESVLHGGGHLLIVAGPGTGKTLTLTHRIAHLIRSSQARPEQILALTFTNKAAKEMRERINALTPAWKEKRVPVSTFHGFCLEVLRKDGVRLNIPNDFSICPEGEASILAREVISESGGGKRVASRFLKCLPRMKLFSVMGDSIDESYHDLLPFFRDYNQKLHKLAMLDLDDLEVETLRLFQQHEDICRGFAQRFPKIFVDEYQDTNPIQVALLKILVQAGPCDLCAIGDPDQAIYGFRGADVTNFHRFPVDFPGAKETILLKNYRSTRVILSGSSSLMEKENPLKCSIEGGDLIRMASCRTHSEEAEMAVEQIEKLMGGTTYFSLDSGRVSSHEEGEDISFGDIAILFRLNAQGDALEEAFRRAGIPFIRSGKKPFTRRYPVNILWGFFRALQYPAIPYYLKTYLDSLESDTMNGEEILRQCRPGESITDLIDHAAALHAFDCSEDEPAEALRRLREIAENFKGDLASFLDTLSLERGIDHMGLSGDRVALMSIHAAKGLEWPVVFITGCEDSLMPCTLFGDQDDGEEKRLFYVGMTRARRKLILSHAGSRNLNGRMLHQKPSPFLDLIPEELCGPLHRPTWKRKKVQKQLPLF